MRILRLSGLILGLSAYPLSAAGQKPKPVWCEATAGQALSAHCQRDFDRWTAAEKKWEDWTSKYGNSVVRTSDGYGVVPRPDRPPAPDWVSGYCADPTVFSPNQVCEAYDSYLAYDWLDHVLEPAPFVVPKTQKGVGEKADFWTWFLNHLHFDLGWVPMSSSQNGTLGVVGLHLTLAQISDRMFIFGPGEMIILTRDERGKRVKQGASTWGLSIRLKEIPVTRKTKVGLYFNLANLSWNTLPVVNQFNSGRVAGGLSIALKK